ncbi:hypothetical protein LCGC14_3000320, partial [marine sediment metagenome]
TAQGSSLHEAYENYLPYNEGWDTEISFAEEIEGVTFVGTLDSYNRISEELVSLKQTSIWGPSYKIEDYTIQENCYKWFLSKQDKEVKKIFVDVFYRNWKLADKNRNRNYPEIPFEVIELELWDNSKTEKLIRGKIKELLSNRPCNRADRWSKFSALISSTISVLP